MQMRLKKLAQEFDAMGDIEYPVEGIDPERKAFIDVVWFDQKGDPLLALELDSSLRTKSIRKLLHAKREYGFPYVVWICYTRKPKHLSSVVAQHDPERLVYVIHLPGVNFPKKKSQGIQDTLF